jgi:ubiquinone/menaquinone biosynthesis C-methylase UbiE
MIMSIAIGLNSESAGRTYHSVADDIHDGLLNCREQLGKRTVARLDLPDGASVLDVGCGTGAAAILAAELVGQEGRVIGVDLSSQMVMRARANARARGIRHADFIVADQGQIAFPDESFDAVINVFSIFLAPDLEGHIRALWRLVRPGGQLAVTTWGPRSFEPAFSAWLRAVEQVCPGTVPHLLRRNRLVGVPEVRNLFASAGIADAEVVARQSQQPLRSPNDWWAIILSTGDRWVIGRMTARDAKRAKQATLAWLKENGIGAIDTNVIYAIATKELNGTVSWVI